MSSGSCGSMLLGASAWLGGLGVTVKSNGPDQGTGTSCGGTSYVNHVRAGYEWQCTELVNRLYLTRGWINTTWGGNGGDSSPTANDSMYDEAPTSLSKQLNGSVTSVSPGDVVSVNEYDNGVFVPDGHVLIVNSTKPLTSGTVSLVSQNFGSASDAIVNTTATLTNGTLTIAGSGGWTYSVIGVVHAPTWTAGEAALPNGGTNPNFTSVACHTATSCVAVGYYGNSFDRGLLVTGSSPAWKATDAPLLPGASGGILQSVACPSTSACVAVGTNYASSSTQPLLDTGSGISWQAAEAPVPANAVTPNGWLSAVSCYSTTACAAVGTYYTTTSASGDGLLLTGSETSWTPTQAPLPADAGPDPAVKFAWVACPSATLCVAAGTYSDPATGVTRGLLLTWSGPGSQWQPTETPLPSNAAADPAVQIWGGTCHSTTSCVVTGTYNDSSGNSQGLLLAWSGPGTQWQRTEAPLPSNAAANPGADPTSVACPSATSCFVTGRYDDSSGNFQGLLLTGSGINWKSRTVPLPTNAGTIPNVQLPAVACHSTTSCAATGWYRDSSGSYQGLIVTRSGTSWHATEAPVPADAGSTPNVNLRPVACPSTTWCIAAGNYASLGDALLETGVPS